MATRNIVPRATGEGQIGTSAKTWSAVYANDIAVTNGVTASTFTGDLTGDVTGDVTGTASGNLALTGGTMTGAISFDATGQIGYRATTHESTPRPCKQLILSSTDINHWTDEGGAKMSLHTYDSTGTNTAENGSFGLLATDGTNSADLVGYPSGALTWGGKKVSTSNWTVQNLVPTVSYTLPSWGFCRIAYNENLAIISMGGLKLTNTYTSPTNLFNLPVSVITYFAGILNVESSIKVCVCTLHDTYFEINGYSTANSYIYGNIAVPIA